MYFFNNVYAILAILHDVNILSVSLRLFLAVIIGGIIGLERGSNSHPAGFRTHILVCVAATLTMLTGEFINYNIAPNADPARLGAQVITGMGFIGAGTIFATGKHRIKGLTTAAGLWASACLGLAIGIGFYSGAIIGAILIFLSLAMLPKVENYFYKNSKLINIYVELRNLANFSALMEVLKSLNISVIEEHISSSGAVADKGIAFHLLIKLPKGMEFSTAKAAMKASEGVFLVEEI